VFEVLGGVVLDTHCIIIHHHKYAALHLQLILLGT